MLPTPTPAIPVVGRLNLGVENCARRMHRPVALRHLWSTSKHIACAWRWWSCQLGGWPQKIRAAARR